MNTAYKQQIGEAHVRLGNAYGVLSYGSALLRPEEQRTVRSVQRGILALQKRLAKLRKVRVRP